ncbi:CYFA0S12e04170g1_1 [Cyberlindnera fabianii]|uniref:CYFA0S12e04170g1_1 n=2 Tax=Cyberlindnera fabianii TaxID=36022 RepID=A0A061B1H2_CYBFA|nr:CYFA0S12e04170g1_1 [Cyberlindnera fabianii]
MTAICTNGRIFSYTLMYSNRWNLESYRLNYTSTMELLPEGKKNQVEVTFEDQKKINEFSKLINKRDNISSELEKQKQEKEYLDDVSMEIELLDEEELINYKVSTVFVKLSQEEAVEKLEKDTESVDNTISQLENDIEQIDDKLSELKTALYTKFGDTINLERN